MPQYTIIWEINIKSLSERGKCKLDNVAMMQQLIQHNKNEDKDN